MTAALILLWAFDVSLVVILFFEKDRKIHVFDTRISSNAIFIGYPKNIVEFRKLMKQLRIK
jgi:hypothetical protein